MTKIVENLALNSNQKAESDLNESGIKIGRHVKDGYVETISNTRVLVSNDAIENSSDDFYVWRRNYNEKLASKNKDLSLMKLTQQVNQLHLQEWSETKNPSVFDYLKNYFFSAVTAIDLQPYDIVFFADKIFHFMKREAIRAAVRPVMLPWVQVEQKIENGDISVMPKRLTKRKIIQIIFPAIADCLQPREISLRVPEWHSDKGITLSDYYIEVMDLLKIERQTHDYFESETNYQEKKEALIRVKHKLELTGRNDIVAEIDRDDDLKKFLDGGSQAAQESLTFEMVKNKLLDVARRVRPSKTSVYMAQSNYIAPQAKSFWPKSDKKSSNYASNNVGFQYKSGHQQGYGNNGRNNFNRSFRPNYSNRNRMTRENRKNYFDRKKNDVQALVNRNSKYFRSNYVGQVNS